MMFHIFAINIGSKKEENNRQWCDLGKAAKESWVTQKFKTHAFFLSVWPSGYENAEGGAQDGGYFLLAELGFVRL